MIYKKYWNKNGYYQILKNGTSLIVELETKLRSDVIINQNKRYIRIETGEFKKVVDAIDLFMDYNNDNETMLLKLPYRYSKYEVSFENTDQTLATSHDIVKDMDVKIVIELRGGYNNQLFWNVLRIIFNKKNHVAIAE